MMPASAVFYPLCNAFTVKIYIFYHTNNGTGGWRDEIGTPYKGYGIILSHGHTLFHSHRLSSCFLYKRILILTPEGLDGHHPGRALFCRLPTPNSSNIGDQPKKWRPRIFGLIIHDIRKVIKEHLVWSEHWTSHLHLYSLWVTEGI